MRGVPARDHARGRRRPPRGDLMIRRSAHARLLSVLPLVALALAACARNPVTGKRELALVSKDQEIALGKESAEQVKASDGRLPGREGPGIRARDRPADGQGVGAARICPGSSTCSTTRRSTPSRCPAGRSSSRAASSRTSTRRRSSRACSATRSVTSRRATRSSSSRRQQLAQLGLGVGMIVSPELAQFGQARRGGAAAALPQVRARRGAAGRPARLQVHGGAGLRRRARWRTCS